LSRTHEGFKVSGFGFRVSCFVFRVSCFVFRVSGFVRRGADLVAGAQLLDYVMPRAPRALLEVDLPLHEHLARPAPAQHILPMDSG
jgi:hypothetical protein